MARGGWIMGMFMEVAVDGVLPMSIERCRT